MAYGFGQFGRAWGFGGATAAPARVFSPIDLSPDLWMPSDPLAMFKTSLGSENVSANDDTIGLVLDQSQMGGVPVPDFIAAQAELKEAGFARLLGSAIAATYDPSTGEGTSVRADASNQSYVRFEGLSVNQLHYLEIEVVSGGISVRQGGVSNPPAVTLNTPGSRSALWISTAGTWLTISAQPVNGSTASFIVRNLKEVTGNHAAQPTATSCPKYKAIGSRQFDGSDDCLVGSLTCGAEGNSILAKVSIPEVLDAGAKIIAGLNGPAVTNRFYVGVNGATGTLLAGVGSSINPAGITYTKGKTGIVELSEDTVNTCLYWNGNLEYSEPRSAAPSTTVPYFTGARNNNGTPANFFPGMIEDLLIFQRAITPAERAQILTYWS